MLFHLRIVAGVIIAGLGLADSLEALTLEGHLVQGGMAIGRVEPGSSVTFFGKAVRVSPQGHFVIGFSRDAPSDASLAIRRPNGKLETHRIQIEARTWPIQRIDGLPPRTVSPSPEDLDRIGQEVDLVQKARRRDDPRTDFLQAFIWPVSGRISGVFGSQRILNGQPRRPHYGVDIAAPIGTPVLAPADGVVTLVHPEMFFSGGTLILDHGHGLSTVYMHLHQIWVQTGDRVHQGDQIALVGATGRVTGPHLHWGMNWFDTHLDPSLLVPPMPTAPAVGQ